MSSSRSALRALGLAVGLVLALGGRNLVSASSPTSTPSSATEFRNIFGLVTAAEAFSNAAISPTALVQVGR